MSRKVLRRRVKVILDEWDPIGVDADNEYDSYISGIVRLLESGASAYKIKKHLENLATVSMGLSLDFAP